MAVHGQQQTKLPLADFLSHARIKVIDVFQRTLVQLEEELSHPPLSLVRYKKHISVLEHCVGGLSEIDLQEHACRLLNAVLAPFSSNVDFDTQAERFSTSLLCDMGGLCRAALGSFSHCPLLPAPSKLSQFIDGIEHVVLVYYKHRREIACELSNDWTDATTEPFLRVLFMCFSSSSPSLAVMEKAEDTSVRDSIHKLFTGLVKLLETVSQRICHFICSYVLPHFLLSADSVVSRLHVLWEAVCKSTDTSSATVECGNRNLAFVILCCFSMPFIGGGSCLGNPSHSSLELRPLILDIRGKKEFWHLIQDGLVEQDPLNRKRSMFLLQHCVSSSADLQSDSSAILSPGGVFWWDQENGVNLQQVWSDFMLMMETLEEKQVHIVKPVKPRLANLIAAVNRQIDGRSLLHFSWLGIIWKRVFAHDAKNIVKWGVRTCLSMELKPESPILQKENWNFIFGPLFGVLSQAPVLARDPDLPYGSCPSIVKLMKSFVAQVVEYLSPTNKRDFLVTFLTECKHQVLADIPLCYFSEVLSDLPVQPLLEPGGFLVMRNILNSSLLTHQVVARSAVQCYFLKAALRLTDFQMVGYSEVAMFFGALKTTECLTFGSSAWMDAKGLLMSVAVAQRQRGGDSLSDYLSRGLHNMLSMRQLRGQQEESSSLSVSNLARLSLLALSLVTEDQEKLKDLAPSLSSVDVFADSLLKPALEVITQVSSRPYLPATILQGATEYVAALLGDLRSGENLMDASLLNRATEWCLYQCMENYRGELVQSIARQIVNGSKDPPMPDLVQANFFLSLWNSLDWIFSRCQSSSLHFSQVVDSVLSKTTEVFSTLDASKPVVLSCEVLGVVCLLEWVCSKVQELSSYKATNETMSKNQVKQLCQLVLKMNIHPKFIKPTSLDLDKLPDSPGVSSGVAQPVVQPWGQVVSLALRSVWNCHRFVLEQRKKVGESTLGLSLNVPVLFDALCDCMDAAHGDSNIVLDCLALVVPEMVNHNFPHLLEFMTKCWSMVLSLKEHHKMLWMATKSFLRFAFHPILLMSSEELGEDVLPVLETLCGEIHALGESRSGHYNLLVKHCCEQWMMAAQSPHQTDHRKLSVSLFNFTDVIIEACMFGPVGKKSQKAMNDVQAYVAGLGTSYSTNQLKLMYRHGDSNVRVTIVTFLFQLMTLSSPNTSSSWIVDEFLAHLMRRMVDKSLAMSRSKPRYYVNSLPHRQKTRLWQVILTLVHFITKEMSVELIPLLFESLEFDNQLSVKYIIEWVSTVLLAQSPSLLPTLIDRLAYEDVKTRLACLPSFISIGNHLFTCVKHKEDQVLFCRQFLQTILQWTQGHHVVVRLYAQAALIRVWDEVKRTDTLSSVLAEFAVLDPVVEFTKQHSDVVKFQHKLQSNVYFTLIDESEDWNLETIYYCLPILTQVIGNELISLEDFLEVDSFWYTQDSIPLRCERGEVLTKCRELQSVGVPGDGEVGDSEGDVQKKIVPWSGPEALHELFPDHVVVEGGRNDLEKSIILVSSLVTKPANLGGLSRTCEIFGVTELVIGNKNILEDALFQALSVTSERWLNITEVRVPDLSGYLIAAKQQGFTLVGVEQTANSRCLTSYNFPKRTLLLLGNEREGIPVDLIHHLDQCVEIPQLGLVRSLNVHVSGALVVWEFAKQHLIGQD